MAVKITRDLSTVTSCIDLSVRIVTKFPKAGPLHIFSISLSLINKWRLLTLADMELEQCMWQMANLIR